MEEKMKHKYFSSLAAILSIVMFVSLTLAGCGGKGASSDEANADTITVATSGDAISLDPTGSNDNQSSNVMIQIYEGLVTINPETQEVENLLAEKIDHPDELSYVFTLKKGVKFHNGEELKASDVVFSLKRAIAAPHVQHLFNMIDSDSVKAKDDYTVEMKLKEPYAGVLTALAHPGGFICNEKAVNEGGDNYSMNPVGTGPFKFVSWSKASKVEFERFEDYHATKPSFKKLVFRVIPEPNNRSIELESGNLDIAYDIAPIDVERIEKGEKTKLQRTLDYGTTYLGFNTSKEPFDNPKVREAISHAINLEEIIKKVWMGVAQPATNCMPPTLQYSIAKEKQIRAYDPEKAKALLKEAGFENGLQLQISTNERKQRVDMATLMKNDLAAVGIETTIEVLEWSAFNDLLKNARQDLFMIAWIADTPDPDTFIFPCFHSGSAGEGGNYVYYNNPELDKLLEKARVSNEDKERAELYKEAQELVYDQCVWLPLCYSELLVGSNKNIDGLHLSPFGWYKLATVTKKAAQ